MKTKYIAPRIFSMSLSSIYDDNGACEEATLVFCCHTAFCIKWTCYTEDLHEGNVDMEMVKTRTADGLDNICVNLWDNAFLPPAFPTKIS